MHQLTTRQKLLSMLFVLFVFLPAIVGASDCGDGTGTGFGGGSSAGNGMVSSTTHTLE